jgi:ParB-like chromosome segregation protein Spo0J
MTTPVRYHSTALALLDDADKVRPYPGNPRNGDVEAIMASIRENGCYRPIYAWAETGEILAGNHTYMALLELGESRIPIAWIEADNLNAARKIVLADNRTADQGRYDEAQLLAELEALDGDLEGTGYVADDLDSIRALMDSSAWDDDRGREGAHDEPDDESFNPRIDLRVSARVFDGWRRMLDAQEAEDDAGKLERHLSAGGFLLDD